MLLYEYAQWETFKWCRMSKHTFFTMPMAMMVDTPTKKRKVEHNQKFLPEYMALFPCFHKSKRREIYAFCNVCSADINVVHGGKGDLQKHVKLKKHEELSKISQSVCFMDYPLSFSSFGIYVTFVHFVGYFAWEIVCSKCYFSYGPLPWAFPWTKCSYSTF